MSGNKFSGSGRGPAPVRFGAMRAWRRLREDLTGLGIVEKGAIAVRRTGASSLPGQKATCLPP